MYRAIYILLRALPQLASFSARNWSRASLRLLYLPRSFSRGCCPSDFLKAPASSYNFAVYAFVIFSLSCFPLPRPRVWPSLPFCAAFLLSPHPLCIYTHPFFSSCSPSRVSRSFFSLCALVRDFFLLLAGVRTRARSSRRLKKTAGAFRATRVARAPPR